MIMRYGVNNLSLRGGCKEADMMMRYGDYVGEASIFIIRNESLSPVFI